AAKAGLIGMTKTVAAEVARRGVTVNAVAPGFIETEMTADVPIEMLRGVPVRRAGRPREVAAAVRFLASDAASYITAATLFVDGGMSARERQHTGEDHVSDHDHDRNDDLQSARGTRGRSG